MERTMKHWIWMSALAFASPLWAQIEWVRARVVKVEPEKARITLKHESIPSIQMEAMTMPFKVMRPELLAGLKAGQMVRFTVAKKDDHLMVDNVERVK
jgi:Cu/Ag efflux protein CusF